MSRPRTRSATPFYNETCPICQEEIIEDLEHRDNPPITLPCNHRLHSTCYHEYIQYGNNIKECPICKRRFQLGANNEPIETINENQETERSLVAELTEKYGPGTLNPETGVFVPTPQPEAEAQPEVVEES